MKRNTVIKNSVGGFDLLTERDAGNPVRILTGSPKYSLTFWRSLRRLSLQAIKELEKDNKPQ